MATGATHGELWCSGARDWARYIELHNYPLYEAVHVELDIGSGTRLLDVGCGPGGAASLADRRGAQISGLDALPGSIEVARERVPEGDFRVRDMRFHSPRTHRVPLPCPFPARWSGRSRPPNYRW